MQVIINGRKIENPFAIAWSCCFVLSAIGGVVALFCLCFSANGVFCVWSYRVDIGSCCADSYMVSSACTVSINDQLGVWQNTKVDVTQ
ncbi:hypothetical protein F2P58_02915 [Vibrio fortis]|uniref:Transmembrane protein n=1 Tax=Vibrio fortis TaxID=212667 RepID=A0A5N3RCS3_9VIBR|nr:hypothetical protein [Vibrio fortis]KAB0292100.1 hypothetical protein F2P58_02915 [Vibrio fortis]